MKPQNDQPIQRVGTSLNDQSYRSRTIAPPRQTSAQQAAADLVRGQLSHIYAGNSGENTPHTTPVAAQQPSTQQQDQTPRETTTAQPNPQPPEPPSSSSGHGLNTAPPVNESRPNEAQNSSEQQPSAYQRTMTTGVTTRQPTAADWQQYHSAWQQYYQMYYERHYLTKIYSASQNNTTQRPTEGQPEDSSSDQSVNQKEAMMELRNSIRKKVTESATKARKSRHFMPILAGLVVLLMFVGLQFNRQITGLVMAYTSPGSIEPQRIITDPTTDIDVGPEPALIIPKINVDAPVVYGVGPDHNSQMTAMERGVAHFSIPGANAVPGQVGNTVLAAHSSNDAFARGDYKFVFAHNERLEKGDVIYTHYEGKRYTYSVTSMEVVLPSEVSKIQIDTDKPMLTLISCVPLGTAEKRLLVFAEQISPDITQAEKADQDTSTIPDAANIPGQPSPTLLERLFGAR